MARRDNRPKEVSVQWAWPSECDKAVDKAWAEVCKLAGVEITRGGQQAAEDGAKRAMRLDAHWFDPRVVAEVVSLLQKAGCRVAVESVGLDACAQAGLVVEEGRLIDVKSTGLSG